MTSKKYVHYWIILGFCMTLAACTNMQHQELSPEEKYAIDTMYNNRLNAWRAHVDSLCNIQKDTTYRLAIDSLMKERVAEIEYWMI